VVIQKSPRYTNVCSVLVLLHVRTLCCLFDEGQGGVVDGETILCHSVISVVSGEVRNTRENTPVRYTRQG
jgi:hypothetical protein